MISKLQKRNNEGFTIIEVMIVLAIAALILLIVLLAVPALQRNSRNTTIKNDASSVAGGINTSESDNNGTTPTNVTGTGTVTITNTAPSTIRVNGGTAVTFLASTSGAPTAAGGGAGQVPNSSIVVWGGHTCPTAQGGSGQASARAFALFYAVETSNGSTLQCLDT
ncbi:MAG TPA: prepilin-type N-terminal cleavage/methylation domain-containing protein [Candidatus Saccharimonadales bacterium]|nr:prepilin-type N-terminal cleavage/methylation domain-containing protein [Candidatus Saccharimonadales bacterium]